MKKLAVINVALVVYFLGLICTVLVSYGIGAVFVLSGGAILLGCYTVFLFEQRKNFLSFPVAAATIGIVMVAILFMLGFSLAIDKSLLAVSLFNQIYIVIGFLLLGLFIFFNVSALQNDTDRTHQNVVGTVIGIASFVSFLGFLGVARILPGTVQFIYYSFVLLVFFYAGYFLWAVFRKGLPNKQQSIFALLLSLVMLLFWIVRWQMPDLVQPGLYRVILHLGFVSMIVLPSAIILLKKNHVLIIFILYSVSLDFYFLAFDRDFKFFVNTGGHDCVGEVVPPDPLVTDPGVPLSELFAPVTQMEIDTIRHAWHNKNFSPKNIQIEFQQREPNGDTLYVVSHIVESKRHYGLIRIPAGLDITSAPILMALHGGGVETDVLEPEYLKRIASTACRDVLNKYIVIAPSFRGEIVKGREFCFRSEGNTSDVWQGPAEDAISFLEVVKTLYHKSTDTKVLVMGISRGATVGLLIGGLTEKVDHVIAISTHTDFLQADVFSKERVGKDFARIFFTPQASPAIIRKRMLNSSPYYFAEYVPSFEIHQGTEDLLTTVDHVRRLEQKLQQLHRPDATFKIYYYEGKGHGADDDEIVCQRIRMFANP
ncbi:alpha/beta hydrolase family protein [Pseudochryseolinea flava]|uniref:Peptidase S9 prolyl oligopeptidase catalytic domain-containing protein n=1 Tax=Pseudochryseolinea flava TaxID=2059302 RepID=A0A364Y1M7_9BACT|nr:prolyl oligopeptidase family serine peptidase [Pseudochryseolinea flava]RAW00567.1 hypothetical protein DQQ10_13285 [Pseudochryseolinea flava]